MAVSVFVLLFPPPAHQRECREDDKWAVAHLEQPCPPSGAGRAVLGWPTRGLLSVCHACISSQGLDSFDGARCPGKSQFSWASPPLGD